MLLFNRGNSKVYRTNLDHDHRGRDRATRRKIERDRLVAGHLFRQTPSDHLRQRFLLALSLASELGAAVTKPCDVILRRKTGAH